MTQMPTQPMFDADSLSALHSELLNSVLSELSTQELAALKYSWEFWSRPKQRLPGTEGAEHSREDWLYWIIQAGRGFGKTRTGAETVRVWSHDFDLVNLIAPTADDARDIMIEGESGVLAVCPPSWRPAYEPSKRRLTWPNGARSMIFTADEPERLRGKQHQKLWCDEIASWRYADAWDQAQFGLRLGLRPQAIITATPKPIALIRQILGDAGTVVTRGSTYENAANLAETFLSGIIKRYEGTRLGRQELLGELLDDNPDALFTRSNIEKGRVKEAPQLERVVVAIDPAATSTAVSDSTGLVAVGMRTDRTGVRAIEHGYVLKDNTLKATPLEWAKAAVQMYRDLKADRIVAEVNNGGEMVISTIRTIDPNVPVTAVTATRGKALRAEPVAALYEQGRMHHVGMFAELEDQMCEWNPSDSSAKSPDRMDALVWAVTDLMFGDKEPGIIDFYRRESEKVKSAAKGVIKRPG